LPLPPQEPALYSALELSKREFATEERRKRAERKTTSEKPTGENQEQKGDKIKASACGEHAAASLTVSQLPRVASRGRGAGRGVARGRGSRGGRGRGGRGAGRGNAVGRGTSAAVEPPAARATKRTRYYMYVCV